MPQPHERDVKAFRWLLYVTIYLVVEN